MGIDDKIIDMHVKQLDKCKDHVVKLHKNTSARFWMAMGAIIASIACGFIVAYLLRDYSKRNIEFMPDMAYSRAGESQRFYPNEPEQQSIFRYSEQDFPIEQNDRLPAEGSVYASSMYAYWAEGTGQQVYKFEGRLHKLSKEDRAEVKLMANPFASTDEVIERGSKVFQMRCQACHGVEGVGNAPVTKYGIPAPEITSKSKNLTDGEIFHVIARGSGAMPAHGNHVNHDDRWKLVQYIRQLEGK